MNPAELRRRLHAQIDALPDSALPDQIFGRPDPALKTLEENLPVGLLRYRTVSEPGGPVIDLKVTQVNKMGAAIYGKPQEEIVGKTITELFPNHDPRMTRKLGRGTLGKTSGWVHHFSTDLGKHLILLTFKTGPGEFVCMVGDTSGYKVYELFFENIPVSCLITREADGVVLGANQAFCDLSGYRKTELVGQQVLGLGLWEPMYRDNLLARFAEGGLVRDFRFVLVRNDRSSCQVKSFVQRLTIQGERCFVAMIEDVSEELRLNADLEKSQKEIAFQKNRLEILLEEAPLGIMQMTPDRTILAVNKYYENLTGFSRTEVLGNHSSAFLAAVSQDLVNKTNDRLVSHQAASARLDLTMVRKAGPEITVRCHSFYLPGSPSTPATITAFFWDTTEETNRAAQQEQVLVHIQDMFRNFEAFYKIFRLEATPAPATLGNHGLTDRDLLLVRLLRKGLTNGQIALETHRSLGTVKVTISRLYKKLNVYNRAQLLVWVQQNNLPGTLAEG